MRTQLLLLVCMWVSFASHPLVSPAQPWTRSNYETLLSSADQPSPVLTRIRDIHAFLERCPNEDAAYPQLKQDFRVLLDGQPIVPDLSCTEPVSALPLEQLTNQFVAMQSFRTIYYMSYGTEGHLPWTDKSLYDWMSTNIGGINFKTAPGQSYCCDFFDGKPYIAKSLNTYTQYEGFFDWSGIANAISFYAHETRHMDPGAPSHANGCPDFPNPSDPYGCDDTYDLNNLGAYGVQYWLESQWAMGLLNVGIGCLPAAQAQAVVEQHARNANFDRGRFVNNPPPLVTASQPYGGVCMGNSISLPLVLK